MDHTVGFDGTVLGLSGTAAAVLIFAATYTVIAIGRLPGFYLDRAGAALLGASLMVGTGGMSLDEALRSVDFDTIALLLGMMIVVGNLRLSGFFDVVGNWVVTARQPPAAAARCSDPHLGLVFGFSRQRYDLPGADAARPRPGPAPSPQPCSLSAGGRDGVQYRQHCDDHRQPAKHHDRQLLAYPLPDIRRAAVAGGRYWARGGASC